MSTATYFNASVWRIKFEDSDEEHQPKGLHGLFSEDRERWVKAQGLLEGEALWTKRGPAEIAHLACPVPRMVQGTTEEFRKWLEA